MEYPRQQDLQAVKPTVAAPTQTAVEKQHFKHVQPQQRNARRIDQQVEGQPAASAG